jgi:hypothetical protein
MQILTVDFPVPANDDSLNYLSPTTSPMLSKKDWLSVVKRKKRCQDSGK